MTYLKDIKAPADLDWQSWVDRWDRMQERYLVKRSERFEVITNLIRATQQTVSSVVDLGCGTGSLMFCVLDAFPSATVQGVDFDPTMLWLAQARLKRYGNRSHVELLDLNDSAWANSINAPVDAVVSATALHWLNPALLAGLYNGIARILRPGGIFLNADHVGSDSSPIQREWERHRTVMRKKENNNQSDDWDGFLAEYSKACRFDLPKTGGWEGGVEEGLPLAWHMDRLRETGFVHVDCFWRCDCDAIYGGILKQDE
jgi:SAM-dependent methyltransferase